MEQREGYKKTKIGWIPEDWDVVSFGNLFDERIEINNVDLPLLSVTNSIGIVLRDSLTKKDTSASDKSKYKTVYPNDIAYNTMRLWQGVSALSSLKGIVSPAYTVLKPKTNVFSVFYQYLMKTEWMINWFFRFSSGICSDTNNCKYKAFKKIPAILPPLPEQQKIASILTTVDDKISSIDQQIQQTEQLKKGLMEKLLTEGIGHTEFKDTKIGRIPKDWDINKLDNYCDKICVGFVGTCEKFYTDDKNGVLMIRTGNLQNGRLSLKNLKYVSFEFHKKNKKSQLQIDDLIIARHGSSGQAVLVPNDFPEANCLNSV